MKPIFLIGSVFFSSCLFGYGAYRLGLDGGLARSTYVQSIALREEKKCFAAEDIKCLRANWEMRAAMAAEGARRGIASPMYTGAENELHEYLEWYATHVTVKASQK